MTVKKTHNTDVNMLSQLRTDPDKLIKSDPQYVEACKRLVKSHYERSKASLSIACLTSRSLPALYVDNFDELGIWKQLESDNDSVLPSLVKSMARVNILSIIDSRTSIEDNIKSETDEETEDQVNTKLESLNSLIKQTRKKHVKAAKHKQAPKSSIVDDDFFRLLEMEKFLEQEDANEEKKLDESDDDDDEGIDYFHSFSSDEEDEEEAMNAGYEEFFDLPENGKRPKVNEEVDEESERTDSSAEESDGQDEGDEIDFRDVDGDEADPDKYDDNPGWSLPLVEADESDNDQGEHVEDIFGKDADRRGRGGQDNIDRSQLSSFERRQLELKEQISLLEEENLAEKSWKYKGEITADKRPANSLLEEIVQFDHTTRVAPVITEESTKSLESIIIQRIKDAAWDDVERKIKPTEKPYEYRKRLEIDQEKSKLSLAEVYEKEYIKKRQDQKAEVEAPEELEIKRLMRQVFVQLDALSNYNFTPRPAEPEVKVVTNLPAITIEEAIPQAVNESRLLAPREILPPARGDVKSNSEKTSTDRKRERRHKKQRQHVLAKKREKVDKFSVESGKKNAASSNKYVKAKNAHLKEKSKSGTAIEESTSDKAALKSSKAFFESLEAQVKTQVSNKRKGSSGKRYFEMTAKKFKL